MKVPRNFRSPGTKVPENKRAPGTKVPGNFPSPRTKVPGNERSRERKVPKLSSPGNERKVLHRDLSFLGTKGLGYEKSVIQK